MAATVAELQVSVSADTSKADASLSSFSSKLGSVGGTMATAFGAAAIGGVVALAGGMVAATSAAAGFEAQMSAISAVSGATGMELLALQEKALQLGADTSFSASEAAAGIEELIKAGVSVADVLGGGAAAALSLAAAGGLSVAESASIASNAMNVFSLSGSDVGHVADVIAGAANASAIDVHDFGMTLSAAGAVAATVGIGFEDLATATAVMGQAGIKGSDAGTSLKTMLLNLSPSSKSASSQMKALGIITADGANAFFDATGKAKGMSEIAGVLQTATAGLTEQQKIQALQTMFGTDAVRAAAIMAKAGSEGFDEMALSIGKVTAESVAAERLNNLTGALGQLGGSVETVAIKMGLQLTPIIREVVDSLTAMVNESGPLLENFAAMFSEVLAEGIARGKDALRQLGDAWRTVQAVFAGEWSPDASIEPLTLAAGNAATAVKDLGDTLQAVGQQASQLGALDNVASGIETIRTEADLAGARLNEIAASFDRLSVTLGGAATGMSASASSVKALGVAFELSTIGIGAYIDFSLMTVKIAVDVVAALVAIARGFYALANGDIPTFLAAGDLAEASFRSMGTTIQNWADNNVARAKQGFQAISGAATAEMPATAAAVEAGMSEASQAASAGFLEMASAADADLGAMAAAATARFAELSASAGTGTAEAVAAVDTGMAAVGPAVDAGMALAVAGVESGGQQMEAAASAGAASAVAAVEGQTGAASGAGQSLGQALGSGLEGGIMAYVGRVASAAASLVSAAIGAARVEADARSPSKKTEKLGKDMADGLEAGLGKAKIGTAMVAQIRDLIAAAREYVPTANEIARVEGEIKTIKYEADTAALFRGKEMITIDSESLRLKEAAVRLERDLLPLRQEISSVSREIADIERGTLETRKSGLLTDELRAKVNIQVNELEKQKIPLRARELEIERLLLGIAKDSDPAKRLQIEQEEIRKKNSLIENTISQIRLQSRTYELDAQTQKERAIWESTDAKIRRETLEDQARGQERVIGLIKNQIETLGAEAAVFNANEAIIKNATQNEIDYRNRLIAVFTAEGKPIADRITAGKALLEQLHNEGKISDELYNSIKKLTDQTGAAGVATTGMAGAVKAASPALTAITAQQNAMAQSAAELAQREAQAAGAVSALASSLGKLPSWFTPKGGSSSSSGSLFSPPSLSVPSYTAPTQSGGGSSIVPGQSTVPGGSIIPMSSASSSGGRQDSMTVNLQLAGGTSKRLVIEGYDLAVREGWTPGGLTG